jgi:hypothetical protein
MGRCLIFLAAAAAAYAQGTTPKASAAEYPVHAEIGADHIGAEYMVRSFNAGEEMYIAENYLVVEVALFPPQGKSVDVDVGKFSLRVSGRKNPLMPDTPSVVAASLHHRDWTQRIPLPGIGMGGSGVGMGAPRTQSPFPGGQDPNRLPTPPGAPDADPNVPPKETVKPEDVLMKTALPAGMHKGPVSGFIYFAWKGKASSIKSIDLLYDGVLLKLR